MNKMRSASFIVGLVSTGVFFVGTAFADNITIYDGKSTTGWYGANEDNEVEPGMVTGQKWDLEAFILENSSLSVIGGYNFMTGEDGWEYGDIFIDVNGNAIYGDALAALDNPTGGGVVQNTFGYDYVFDISFANGVYSYDLFDISGVNSETTTVWYSQNEGSNPWRYDTGGTLVESGNFNFFYYGTDDELADAGFDYGLTGATHYVMTGFDLSFLSPDTQFLVHTTMECGNDNLMGLATTPTSNDPVPEPATMLLFGTGLAGLAGISRRKRK